MEKQREMNQDAFKWWKKLSDDEQNNLIKKWFPNYDPFVIGLSPTRIERIYNWESKN